jgi:hypothetical protein
MQFSVVLMFLVHLIPTFGADFQPCSKIETGYGSYDLTSLGTLRSLLSTNEKILGWVFAFNACTNVDLGLFYDHCKDKEKGPAMAGGRVTCRKLGDLQHREIMPLLPTKQEGSFGISINFKGGDALEDNGPDNCGAYERQFLIHISCADIDHAWKVQLHENTTRPCAYIASVDSQAGCPLQCARDISTGAVCGGTFRGTCSFSGNKHFCKCRNGHYGDACSQSSFVNNFRSPEVMRALCILFFCCAILFVASKFVPAAILTLNKSSLRMLFLGHSTQRDIHQYCSLFLVFLLLFSDHGTLQSIQQLKVKHDVRQHPQATCAFISAGATFRLGGEKTLIEGAIESYDDQIDATKTHVALLHNMFQQYNIVCDIFFATYNTSFSRKLEETFQSAWPHQLKLFRLHNKKIGILGLYAEVLEAALPAETFLNTTYEFLLYIRADMKLKPYFARVYDPLNVDHIQLASLVDNAAASDRRGYAKGRPWVNELAFSFPRMYFPALRPGDDVLKGQALNGHGED